VRAAHDIRSLAQLHADASALADDRVSLTYGDLLERVETFAAQLAREGFAPGDVLAVMLPNRVELVIAMFATWRLGGAMTPVNPALTEEEATHQVQDSGADLVLNLGPDAPTGGARAIHVDEMATEPTDRALPELESRLDDTALVIYTSGSTGKPKGVVLDHANVAAMTSSMCEHFGLDEHDHCLLILPLFHVNALMVSVLGPLLAGGRVSIVGRFSADTFFEHVERLRPTYFSAVPTIYSLLVSLPETVRPDVSSLRFVVCGAAPVSRELLEACQDRFGFTMVEGYGLTEGTCASACNPVDGIRKLGTVGPALPGQQIRIVAPDGSEAPRGERGEVLIAGPTVMRGYLNNPDATAASIVDGWLRTGDVGVLDGDGYLQLVDRIKDMVIRGGENLYPKEIEAVIAGFEGVLECAVIGEPDAVLGEVPVAYVVPYPDTTVHSGDVLTHCRAQLTRVKVPVAVHVTEALPKNPVGKIDKPALRTQHNHSRRNL
jgi:long-chain acyl-CoA synthetase